MINAQVKFTMIYVANQEKKAAKGKTGSFAFAQSYLFQDILLKDQNL